MGGTCGTDCQSLKLSNNINMDSDVRRNRANSKLPLFKTKNININKLSSLPSPSHSAETPTSTTITSPQSPKHQQIPSTPSINNWVHQVLASTTPIPDDELDTNLYDHIIQVVGNEDLFRSKLMTKMDDEDLILTELYENGDINTKPNLFRPNTPSAWDESDMDDLADEMKKELQSMVNTHTSTSISMSIELSYSHNNDNQYDNEYIMDTNNVNNNDNERSSNLIQTWCDPNEWDSEHMELEEDQMKKHLNHLKLKYESSTSNQIKS